MIVFLSNTHQIKYKYSSIDGVLFITENNLNSKSQSLYIKKKKELKKSHIQYELLF